MLEQENKMYQNQIPCEENKNPNGFNNCGGRKHKPKRSSDAIVITVSILLTLTLLVGSFVGSFFVVGRFALPYLLGNYQVDNGLLNSNGADNNNNNVTNGKPSGSFQAPEFNYSDGTEDLSTNLTDIYNNCSPSCCTIRVMLGGRLYSIGSGFVIDAQNGYIATNHHVIANGDKIEVAFYNGDFYTAEVVGSNSVTDLAVLKIEAQGLKAVTFGDSDKVCVGEDVVAIGTPYDESLAGTMTCGIISGVARNIDITNDSGKVVKTMTLLQTDCSINPGNSGGPLIDMAGNVIGITSLKLVDEQFEGIGFAIPITEAIEIFQKLIAGENIGDNPLASATPQIGVTVYEVKAGLQAFNMLPACEYPQNGAFVTEISRTSSAYLAGLSVFDIIIDFNGTAINTINDLSEVLKNYSAGDTVTVTVFRFNRGLTKGEEIEITFVLDAAQ